MALLIDVGDGSVIAAPTVTQPPPPPLAPLPPAPSSTASNPIPQAGVPLVDLGDGTFVPAPPASSSPTLTSAPLAPAPTGSIQGTPIPQPGHPLIDLGDVLGAPDYIFAPPASGPGSGGSGGTGDDGGDVGGTADLSAAEALALANHPDLSDLPGWELVDPYSLQFLSADANPVLKGGGALSAIAQACADFGVDTLAVVADALHEGANGGMGDGGLAYGPFQDHLTEFAGRPFYGKGRNNEVVNRWAWTENGIRYSVRQMTLGSPSARGLRGHAAVYAIVYGYERPQDKAGAYKTRATEYDGLVKRGSGWAVYAAPLFHGPASGGAVDTTPIVGSPHTAYKPAGVTANWRGLVDVFKLTVPDQRDKVSALGKSLKEVFR